MKPCVTRVLCPAVSESWPRGQEPRGCRSLSRLPAVHRLCLANDTTGKLLVAPVSTEPGHRDMAQCLDTGTISRLTCAGSPSWACTLTFILAAGFLGVCLAKSLKALADVSPQHGGCSRSLLPVLKLIL